MSQFWSCSCHRMRCCQLNRISTKTAGLDAGAATSEKKCFLNPSSQTLRTPEICPICPLPLLTALSILQLVKKDTRPLKDYYV